MGHGKGVTYVMNVGDHTYSRLVKIASDANEKSFRLAAMAAEATSSGTPQNKLHSGKIQQKDDAPNGAIEV